MLLNFTTVVLFIFWTVGRSEDIILLRLSRDPYDTAAFGFYSLKQCFLAMDCQQRDLYEAN